VKTEFGKNLICFTCGGHLGSLNYFLKNKDSQKYEITATKENIEKSVTCPKCRNAFEKKRISNDYLDMLLDVCYPCSLVWYDREELESLFMQIAEAKIQKLHTKSLKPPEKKSEKPIERGKSFGSETASLIKVIHETRYLSAEDKAYVVDFLAYGPRKEKDPQKTFCQGIVDVDLDFDLELPDIDI